MPGRGGARDREEKSPAFTPPPRNFWDSSITQPWDQVQTTEHLSARFRGAPADVWFWGDRSEGEGWVSSCGPPSFSRRYLLRICT